MHFYFFPYLSLFLSVHFFTSIISATLSPSCTNEALQKCSTQFQCGNLNGIGYPFWGNKRPSYCGKPDLELKCDQDNITHIQILSKTYRILNVFQLNQTLRIARMDFWNDACPSPYENATLNFSLLNYSISSTRMMSLFYDCPVSAIVYPNLFTCVNRVDEFSDAYFLNESRPSGRRRSNLEACKVGIQIPVLQSAFARLLSGELAVWAVFREGFDVVYDGDKSNCKSCDGTSCSIAPQTSDHFDGDGGPVSSPSSGGGNVMVKVGIVVGTLVIAAVGIVIFCCLRRKKTKNSENLEAFLKNHGALAPKRFKYSDVRKMTESFQDKLGEGGYGSVFKGKLPDGCMVAVKVLSETKGNGDDFINEVASISRTSHVNVVALLGFCVEGRKRALIYEFVPNGSLEKFIHVENPLETHSHLGWETLYKIAVGIARGLEYLHRGCHTRILHFDIKPHNILLDQDFSPKISDFGLAKLCVGKDSIVSMTGARGTAGYIAPEVVSRNFGGVSHKADVYSYGMMILEMVGGRKNLDVRVTNLSEIYFPHWIYKRLDLNEDLGLHGVTNVQEEEIARKMILVGLWCIQIDPSNRPAMSKVLEMLEGSLEALKIPPKPFVSSPAREHDGSSTTSIS